MLSPTPCAVDLVEINSDLDSGFMLLPFLLPGEDCPGGPVGKASVYSTGDPGLIPGWGRSSGKENGKPLQFSCLENPMHGGAW